MSTITSEELRRLLDAATPGPWGVRGDGYDGEDIDVFPNHAPPPDYGDWAELARVAGGFGDENDDGVSTETVANAQLIARLPDLAAELLTLREKHERQQEIAGKLAEALSNIAETLTQTGRTLGAPGDYGYSTPAGQALFAAAKANSTARAALSEWEAGK